MGKISNYTRVLLAKLQDVFVCDQTDNNVTTTKSVTVEQIGDAICGEQVHSDLETDNQTIIGSINELAKDKNVADEYDDTHTYNTGDVTIYDNTLYICNTNNTTGTFDPSKWTATTIDNIIGDLTTLTTTDKSSLVGAVNEVNGNLPKQVYKNLNWETVHSFVAEVNTLYLLTADSGNDLAIARLFSNGVANLGVVSGSKITGISYENGRLKVSTNNCGMIAIRIA